MDRPLSPELIARFRADCRALLPGDARLALAVSGGPDSLALLLLAHASFTGQVEAATVDHGLRAESAEEARFVAQVCADLGVPHAVLSVTVKGGNLQSEARDARYGALGHWMRERGLTHLATAHHADDQAETLLMRLGRGSGVAGLAGVRASGALPGAADLMVLRPLLGWRKAELSALVQGARLKAVRDPSNEDEGFDRVRMRRALAEADWLDPLALSASASHIADAEEALGWMTQREWGAQVRRDGDTLAYTPHAPRAVRLRVLVRMIEELGEGSPRGGAAARLLDALENGDSGNVAGVLASNIGGEWVLRREPLRSHHN